MAELFPCYICKQRLPHEFFYKNSGRATGLSSACKRCAKTAAVRWNRDNKALVSERDRRRADKRAASTKLWQRANRKHLNEYMRNWNAQGKRRPGPRAMAMLTPNWANRFFLSEIYSLARLRSKLTGIPWEVDHIVPLNGSDVCGLHVEHNLAVIPRFANRSKKNHLVTGDYHR